MKTITYDVLRELLPSARSYSNYVSGICPFHDDSKPSLMLYQDGWFRCLACGVVGNYEKLYRKLRGYDSSKVISVVESFSAPSLPVDLREQETLIERSHYSITKFEQLRWYLENRGVAGRIEPCRLGYYNGWYTVPFYSHYGVYLGMVARAGTEIQRVSGLRFIQPKGQKPMMYCPDWRLTETANTIAVVFGIFDALAVSDLRFAVVTPIMGKDSFDPTWLDFWRKKIVIIPDAGEESTAIELAGKLGWRGSVLKLPYPEGIKDPAGYLEIDKRGLLASQLGGPLS